MKFPGKAPKSAHRKYQYCLSLGGIFSWVDISLEIILETLHGISCGTFHGVYVILDGTTHEVPNSVSDGVPMGCPMVCYMELK